MNKNLLTIVAVAIIACGAGFFGGVQYQKSIKSNTRNFQAMGQQNGNQQNSTGKNNINKNRGMNGPVSGEITNVDGTSITIKTKDGSSKIVMYSSSTTVNKTSQGSSSDLKTGEQVMVIGNTATDGTVTAQTISVGGTALGGIGPQNGEPPQGN